MSSRLPSLYSSDLPIQSSAEDKFDFTPFAHHVVDEIVGNQQPESLVVGLSGTWGSGKTSLLNLMDERLQALRSDDKPIISIRYVPWRVKNSEALLTSFLSLLIEKIEEEMSKDKTLRSQVTKSLAPVKDYAKALGQLESGIKPIVKVISSLGVPLVEGVFNAMAEVRSSLAEETSLDIETLHKNAYEALKSLQITTIVMIDDLDRLEPSEIIDVLRLVRSTAQLPYVTFILCYDHNNVREAIETTLKVDGIKFLGKLIQLPIFVPSVPPEVLLQSAITKIEEIFPQHLNTQTKTDSIDAIEKVIDQTTIIKTPRDIHRILNTFNFERNFLQTLDGTSMICLAVIQSNYPEVYDWINGNVPEKLDQTGENEVNHETIEKYNNLKQTLEENNNAASVILSIMLKTLKKEKYK